MSKKHLLFHSDARVFATKSHFREHFSEARMKSRRHRSKSTFDSYSTNCALLKWSDWWRQWKRWGLARRFHCKAVVWQRKFKVRMRKKALKQQREATFGVTRVLPQISTGNDNYFQDWSTKTPREISLSCCSMHTIHVAVKLETNQIIIRIASRHLLSSLSYNGSQITMHANPLRVWYRYQVPGVHTPDDSAKIYTEYRGNSYLKRATRRRFAYEAIFSTARNKYRDADDAGTNLTRKSTRSTWPTTTITSSYWGPFPSCGRLAVLTQQSSLLCWWYIAGRLPESVPTSCPPEIDRRRGMKVIMRFAQRNI